MEVYGKKVSDGQDKLPCKSCEDHESTTTADGFCQGCDEYMCKSCFDTHKKFKVSKGHTLVKLEEARTKKERKEELETRAKHLCELVKFNFPKHEQVGCGDCMIFDHRSCKIEYIHDKADTFKDSQEFNNLVKEAEKCHREATEMLSSIRNNKKLVEEINEKFTRDVNTFKEEVIAHVTKLAESMLRQGESIKAMDIKCMDEIENENERVIDEISVMTVEFESLINQPNKLFVSSILHKSKLKELRKEIDSVTRRNKKEVYEFKRDGNIDRSVIGCKELGNLLRIKMKETESHEEEVRPKKTTQKPLLLQNHSPCLTDN